MSRAFVKEGDSTASGSLVDRFYQGLLGLSDPARVLVGKRQQQAWLTSQPAIEAARRDARAALGADSYREVFEVAAERAGGLPDRKSTRLNSSHQIISYAVFCLKKKKTPNITLNVHT